MHKILWLMPFLFFTSCTMKQSVDFIGYNGKIFTVDSTFSVIEAFAVKDGKFVATGSTKEILKNYKGEKSANFKGELIFPGLTDSHCHLLGLGMSLENVDLRGVKSFDEIIQKIEEYKNNNPSAEYIFGEGWDQNLWEDKQMPSNELLNKKFPDIPVVLKRIDFHATVANEAAINKAELNINQSEKINGKYSGLFMEDLAAEFDNKVMVLNSKTVRRLLLQAQKECLDYGIYSVSAEEDLSTIKVLDSMVNEGLITLEMDIWMTGTKSNMQEFNKPYHNKNLHVTTVKFYEDGALGSRGALLLNPYSDMPKTTGIPIQSDEEFDELCSIANANGFRVATHCIGDKAVRNALQAYGKVKNETGIKSNLPWRIEHSQIVTDEDLNKYKEYNVIPSVQPTHYTSDKSWAIERLGEERMKTAYRYKDLLQQHGWIPFGTDFPIESPDPMRTFYAAVYRDLPDSLTHKNLTDAFLNIFKTDNYIKTLVNETNALTPEEALRAMTIWGCKAAGFDKEIGSIEPGKKAAWIMPSNKYSF